jgi:phage terminase small subunit
MDMPDKKGRFTPKERAFVAAMGAPDATAAAMRAGYKTPAVAGWKLLQRPEIAAATREEARKFLVDKGGAISVYTLASIAVDDKQPAGARVTAATNLGKLSGIAVTDADTAKELHEMTPGEMASYRAKLQRQSHAIDVAMSEQATVVIDHDDSVFG